MTQRVKHCSNSLHLESAACEKYITRLLQKEKFGGVTKPGVGSGNPQKRVVKQSVINTQASNQNQLTKVRPNVKQQNLPSPKLSQIPLEDSVLYIDDPSIIELAVVKPTNPRSRSRSTVAEREPWGQLLKQQRSNDKVSVFGNFDPLRTLHFLAKELQHHLESTMPEDGNLKQIVADMQYALKRVPPEVASIVHLQQAIDLLPSKKNSRTLYDNNKPEKLKLSTSEKDIQTDPCFDDEETMRLQKVMEESTLKLEISCRQMESLCEQLKNEKRYLENQLQTERDGAEFLKKKIQDLEFETTDILNPKIKMLEEEKEKLEAQLNEFMFKFETQSTASVTELRSLLGELRASKSASEHECNKLKHQLRLCAIEKEKYIAVLAVRDRQINEIRTEMSQLQEVVNEQLMELHNNAVASIPSATNIAVASGAPWNAEQNKEHIGDVGDTTLSSINSNDDALQHFFMHNPNSNGFRDLPCGDTLHDVPQENFIRRKEGYSKDHKTHHALERLESQSSIRCMFNDLKKTAFDLTGPQNHS